MESTFIPARVQQPLFPTIAMQEAPRVSVLPVIEANQPANLPFIEANTKEVEMSHLKDDCIIPVFSKDNEVTISHQSLIGTVLAASWVQN